MSKLDNHRIIHTNLAGIAIRKLEDVLEDYILDLAEYVYDREGNKFSSPPTEAEEEAMVDVEKRIRRALTAELHRRTCEQNLI